MSHHVAPLLSLLLAQGVRRLGAASVDLCHVALGVLDAYWVRTRYMDVAACLRFANLCYSFCNNR
jgi:fructose-1,6-bisphosphatase/inositol monophosphatase family enzyme